MSKSKHILEVWGDFACFTRPELKAERWSYPCPTPSAARGIFDSIYFKADGAGNKRLPRFYWQIERIELLTGPSYIALRRNEVSARAPADRTVASWAKGKTAPTAITADSPERRQQRQTMALRSPRYRLHASIKPYPGNEKMLAACQAQFRRRAAAGKCFMQPAFGCREFACYFRLIEDITAEKQAPVAINQNLGMMLYDVFDLSKQNTCNAAPFISMFHAEIRDGVLEVPPFDSENVLKPDRAKEGQ